MNTEHGVKTNLIFAAYKIFPESTTRISSNVLEQQE